MKRTAGGLIVFLFAALTFIANANAAGDENSSSHVVHLSAASGPLLACGDCHDVSITSLLKDGQNLAGTTVCNPCHSPGGIYNGVDSGGGSIGARDNWDTVVYSGGELAAGKEKWCVGCHDDSPAVVKGVSAPNIAGSESGKPYGFYITGHGKHGYEQAITCLTCHDASRSHVDGDARTYTAAANNYQAGFRLKSMADGKPPLDVPRTASGAMKDAFLLCFTCHDSTPFLTEENTDTNFRADRDDTCVPLDPAGGLVNKHWYHLQASNAFKRWDSDWDGAADSLISCTACHNVHGPRLKNDPLLYPNITHAPAMIRTGEEMGRASSLNLDYLVNPCPDWNTHSPTNELSDSTGGVMKFQGPARGSIQKNGVCIMCHNEYQPYFREPKEILSCDNCHAFGSHQTHVRSTAEGGMLGIDCGQCHDTDHFPQFADHQDRAHTTVCDPCHSADGAVLAKQYWANPGNWVAAEGEAGYCGSCHDATPGYNGAATAFNVMGDKTTYGFYVTGHGKASGAYARLSWQDTAAAGNPAAQKGCGACHDLASKHFNNAGKRLKAGFENDQANSNCNQCHEAGRGATHDPQFYTTSADYENSAHSAKLCTECHNVHGSSGNYPAMTLKDKQVLCANCHNNGGHPGVGNASYTVNGKNYTLQCVSCHNVHVVTGTYSQASQDKTPVTMLTDITNAWGDTATEKMNAYAGSGTYRTPNGSSSFPGDKLPDYASFCLGCHAQTGNPPFGLDWNNDPHGHNSANQPDGYGVCPNWFACGKAFGWDGDDCKADQAEFPSACWPVIPRGAGDELFSREPYTHVQRVAGANFTLSCTDCHTGHGSGTLSRAHINGDNNGGFTNWNNTCNYCHYYYSDWHAGMACGNASCHEVNSLHRMKKNHGSGGTRTQTPGLVLHYAFENNLKDSGGWQMDGKWYSTAGSFASGKVGQAGVFGEDIGAQVGTENTNWSTDEGYHGTWKYTEMKFNTTLEAWVNPTDGAKSEYTIFTKHTGYSQGGYRLSIKKINGLLRVAFNCQIDSNGTAQGGAAGVRGAYSSIGIPLNVWTHVAATFDMAGADRNPADPTAGRIRIYVNGRDVTTSDASGNNMQPGPGETSMFAYSENSPWNESICYNSVWCASEFAIGGFDWETTNYIGMIDEAKVWNITKNADYFTAYQSQTVPYISNVLGLIGNNQLTVRFSEPVYGSGGSALTASAFTLTDTNNNNPRTISGVSHLPGATTAVLTMSAALTAADVDSDTLAAAANAIFDNSGQAASTRAVKIGLSDQCPTSPVTIPLNEAAGRTYIMDSQGILYGAISGGSSAFPGDGSFHGNGSSAYYIDFSYNSTCLIASTAMTIEARVKPTGLSGTGTYARRIIDRSGGGANYQISVWRNNNTYCSTWPTTPCPGRYNAPSGEASIVLWALPTDVHGDKTGGTNSWKTVQTNYTNAATGSENNCPIVSDHWYYVKVVWNTNKPGGTPGQPFLPADIYVEDQGTDGNGAGKNWTGLLNCTDSDQSLKDSGRFYAGDQISTSSGNFRIGSTPAGGNYFNGLIDWITWKNSVD